MALPYVRPYNSTFRQPTNIVAPHKYTGQVQPPQQGGKVDTSKYIQLGDGALVEKESFSKLPQDSQDVGKRVGLQAMQTSIQKHQDIYNALINDLKPYTDENGNVNLAEAIKNNAVDVNKLVSENVFTQDVIDNARNVSGALVKIQPYSLTDSEGKTSYDVVKFIQENPNDVDTLKILGLSDEDIQKDQIIVDALSKIANYAVTNEQGQTSYDIAKYLQDNPTDAQTLINSGITQDDINKALNYNEATNLLTPYITDGKVNLSQAIQSGVDMDKIISAGLISAETVQQARDAIAQAESQYQTALAEYNAQVALQQAQQQANAELMAKAAQLQTAVDQARVELANLQVAAQQAMSDPNNITTVYSHYSLITFPLIDHRKSTYIH